MRSVAFRVSETAFGPIEESIVGEAINPLFLDGWTVTRLSIETGVYRLWGQYGPAPADCPRCGSRGRLSAWGTVETRYADAPMHGRHVVLHVAVRRFRCGDCGATSLQPLPDMDRDHRMTRRCRAYVAARAAAAPYTTVAAETGVDPKIVGRIARSEGRRETAAECRRPKRRAAPPPGSPAISARRLRILHLAADGLSNKEIARRLGIVERTVKDHWERIFAALAVRTRAGAVARAIRLGLIE